MTEAEKKERRLISIRKAVAKYDEKNSKNYGIKLNRKTDIDLIEYLDSCSNKQIIIKEALRMYIKKHK